MNRGNSRLSLHTDAIVTLVAVIFLGLRLALFFVREPFFDEIFTVWITRKSAGGILEALRLDSGPPLYYLIVHALRLTTVSAARLVSLFCAAVSLAVILSARELGRGRFAAAVLLAAFPPAVLFAVDARSYAMCAMFVTIAIVLVDRGGPFEAAIALAAAAWSHYYGVLFFPILLLPDGGRRRSILVRAGALVFASGLFAPGLALALQQPREATQWMGFPPSWPSALFPLPPVALLVAFAICAVVAGARVNRFTAMAAIPVAMAVAFAVAGRPVYFPLRFESVLAPALALAIGVSLERWGTPIRTSLTALLVVIGIAISFIGVSGHARRDVDDYRAAATWAAAHVPAGTRIVANGYLYLETVMAGRDDAIAWPPGQGLHPGWRAPVSDAPLPQTPFVFAGETGSHELVKLLNTHRTQPLFVNRRAMVVRVP